MPRTGLELLTDTLLDQTPNSCALGRVLKAIDSGIFTVNGQSPDKDYPLGEYLIHGGRIIFDISYLSTHQQNEFFNYITNGQAQTRTFATHRLGGLQADGGIAEIKSGVFGAIDDALRGLGSALGVTESKHFGLHLAIGGRIKENQEGMNQGIKPCEDGRWGHMYVHKDTNAVLIGIESSAPGLSNMRTGEAHSMVGASDKLSPFLEEKLDSKQLQESQKSEGKTPLNIQIKYNWATVKITSAQFEQLSSGVEDAVSLVHQIPRNAQASEPDRVQKMQDWHKQSLPEVDVKQVHEFSKAILKGAKSSREDFATAMDHPIETLTPLALPLFDAIMIARKELDSHRAHWLAVEESHPEPDKEIPAKNPLFSSTAGLTEQVLFLSYLIRWCKKRLPGNKRHPLTIGEEQLSLIESRKDEMGNQLKALKRSLLGSSGLFKDTLSWIQQIFDKFSEDINELVDSKEATLNHLYDLKETAIQLNTHIQNCEKKLWKLQIWEAQLRTLESHHINVYYNSSTDTLTSEIVPDKKPTRTPMDVPPSLFVHYMQSLVDIISGYAKHLAQKCPHYFQLNPISIGASHQSLHREYEKHFLPTQFIR